MASAFFDNLFSKKSKNKESTSEPTVLESLYHKPKRDTGGDASTFPYITSGYVQQGDLVYLPNDRGYQYALVLVDMGSRKVDAEPLKERQASDIIDAIKSIYKRKILKKPKLVTFDMGSEFANPTRVALQKMGIQVKYALTGRHRQVALAERKNQTIGSAIHKLLVHDELAHGNATSQWVDVFRDLIDSINKHVETPKPDSHFNDTPTSKGPIELLKRGDKVRIQLDEPRNINNVKLIGKFRSSDIRWTPETYTIDEILMKPNQPVMYTITGKSGVAYTRNQLQFASENEKKPEKPIIETDDNRFDFEKIVGKKIEKGVTYYLVKWRGYGSKDNTYESRDELIKDVPQAVERYEKKINKLK